MNGNMMQQPLLISTLLTHAERHHGGQQIVSRRVEGDIHRTTYRELAERSRRMANALAARGVRFGDQVVWIADHAEDQVLFFDLTFLPLIEAIASRVKTIKAFVAMTGREHMPAQSKVPNLLCYEELIADASPEFAW